MSLSKQNNMRGYLRTDGRKGIRNLVIVVYLVECAHHVAREITNHFRQDPVQLIGFGGCYPNGYADRIMNNLCTHPNVGAVLLVSLGCESFNRNKLYKTIESSGRPVQLIGIQESGGTTNAIKEGIHFINKIMKPHKEMPTVPISMSDLVVGVVCGGSDATSGITANPAVGKAFDLILADHGTAIFENTGEMIGLDKIASSRATTRELGVEIEKAILKASKYYTVMGHGSFAPGNADGGLSTMEEKSMGAYCKTGSHPINGIIKPGDLTPKSGLYLMDIVPDGDPKFGFPNPNDSSEIVELIASGAHCVLFTTGRGSVVGSALSPIIKVCANPETFHRMPEDMDVNAGKILYKEATIDQVGEEIVRKIQALAEGSESCSEKLGHQEFVLGYKTFEPIGPACLPL